MVYQHTYFIDADWVITFYVQWVSSDCWCWCNEPLLWSPCEPACWCVTAWEQAFEKRKKKSFVLRGLRTISPSQDPLSTTLAFWQLPLWPITGFVCNKLFSMWAVTLQPLECAPIEGCCVLLNGVESPYLTDERKQCEAFCFVLIGRKEKAGNTDRPESFHHTHCFNMGEVLKAVEAKRQYQSTAEFVCGAWIHSCDGGMWVCLVVL